MVAELRSLRCLHKTSSFFCPSAVLIAAYQGTTLSLALVQILSLHLCNLNQLREVVRTNSERTAKLK